MDAFKKSRPYRTEPDIAEAVPPALSALAKWFLLDLHISHNSSAPGNRPLSWTGVRADCLLLRISVSHTVQATDCPRTFGSNAPTGRPQELS